MGGTKPVTDMRLFVSTGNRRCGGFDMRGGVFFLSFEKLWSILLLNSLFSLLGMLGLMGRDGLFGLVWWFHLEDIFFGCLSRLAVLFWFVKDNFICWIGAEAVIVPSVLSFSYQEIDTRCSRTILIYVFFAKNKRLAIVRKLLNYDTYYLSLR